MRSNCEDLIDILSRDFGDMGEVFDPGIGDHNVQFPEGAGAFVGEFGDLLGVGHVGLDDGRFNFELFHLFERLVGG